MATCEAAGEKLQIQMVSCHCVIMIAPGAFHKNRQYQNVLHNGGVCQTGGIMRYSWDDDVPVEVEENVGV